MAIVTDEARQDAADRVKEQVKKLNGLLYEAVELGLKINMHLTEQDTLKGTRQVVGVEVYKVL